MKTLQRISTIGAFTLMACGIMVFAIGCSATQLGQDDMLRFIIGGIAIASTSVLVLIIAE